MLKEKNNGHLVGRRKTIGNTLEYISPGIKTHGPMSKRIFTNQEGITKITFIKQ